MKLVRVLGTVTLNKRLDNFVDGQLVLGEALDAHALASLPQHRAPKAPMPESLVVYDTLGVAAGQIIAVSEGREAAAPFYPARVPIDAYSAAILDHVEWNPL
ncbi:MAG: EutN/CcmL family microcompartment protein [Planctomycetota bacterium]